MTTPATTAPSRPKTPKVRFIVRSAEEAVTRIRSELGPKAKVLSVRQVTGGGLKRFLASPRLEVIARVEEEALPAPVAKSFETEEETSGPVARASGGGGSTRTCREVLEAAGLGPSLLASFSGDPAWREIERQPASEGLTRVVAHLRTVFEKKAPASAPVSAAFLGSPGAGKTTAICKRLARDVFLHNRSPRVLRLEIDKPHMDDGLALYCDVLGLRCLRSVEELEPGDDSPLYCDIPGFSLRDRREHESIARTLDRIGIRDRVLILNAAYDALVLKDFCRVGERMGVRYLGMTHLDELSRWGKLWSFVLHEELNTLFLSFGQNVAGDYSEDIFGRLIERTFSL